MSRKVEIEMTVEDAKAVRAWQRAKDNIAEFDKQGQKTSKTFGMMVTDQVKGIAATAAGFAGVGSVIGGITTSAQLLRAEYDNLLQRQEQSRRALLGRAPLEAELIANASRAADLGETPKQRGENVLKLTELFAGASGVETKDFLPTASQAVSSRGNLPVKDAMTVAALATLTSGGRSEIASARTSLGLTLAQNDIPLEAGLGFGIAAGEVMPVANQDQLASGLGRTIPAGMVTGATAPEVAAIYGTFATKTGDVEGQRSSTFTLQTLAYLDKLAPQFERVGDQIDFIVNNPKRFADDLRLEKIPGEAANKPLMQALLTADSADGEQLRRDITANTQALPRLSESGKVVRDLLRAYSASDAIDLNALESGLNFQIESAQAADVTGATTAALREKHREVLQATGFGYVDQLGARAKFATNVDLLGEDPKQFVQRDLRARADDLTYSGGAVGTQGGVSVVPRSVSEEDRERASRLRSAADSIDTQIIDRLDQLIDLERENRPQVNVRVNNRPAKADVRVPPPSGRHSRLSASPVSGGR